MPFKVYIDDSGTSPSQPVACATALIIPAKRILQLENEWKNLKNKENLSDWHTSEFVFRNPHSEFAGWVDAKRERVFSRVREIIKKYAVQLFSFAVKKDDYEQCVTGDLREIAGKYHYTWAIRHVVRLAETWKVDRSVAEPFEWIFDWMEKNDPARKEVEIVMEQAEEEARVQREVEHEYTHIDFRHRSSLAGLQCADLAAWTNYNFALKQINGKPLHPFARLAWDDFASMPASQSRNIHPMLDWNFAVALKRDHLADWAQREAADGRSILKFKQQQQRRKLLNAAKIKSPPSQAG